MHLFRNLLILLEMCKEDAADFFDHQRLPLARVARSHKKLGLHIIHVSAGVFDDAVVTFRRVFFAVNGDDGMAFNPWAKGDFRQGLDRRIVRRHGIEAGRADELLSLGLGNAHVQQQLSSDWMLTGAPLGGV